jgi:homocitrate synthase
MMPTSRDYILSKYKLHQLKAIEDFVAEAVEVDTYESSHAAIWKLITS